jgi:bile acid-coenzyme A ligase
MDGSTLDEKTLLTFIGQTLTRYKVPKVIEFTDEPLRDEAGKVRRAALRQARLPQ